MSWDDDGMLLEQLDEVLLRTAPGDVEVRLYRSGEPGEPPDDLETYGGAAACDPGQWLVVEVSNRGAVEIGNLTALHGAAPAVLGGANTFGLAEGDPAWWAAVWAGPEVVEVRGGGDQAAPVDGWVVLGGPGELPAADVEAVGADGAVLATLPLEPWPQACLWPGQGPQAMPEPGEQPADPAAAEDEVRQAYIDAWDHTVTDRDVKAAAIEDAEGLEAAREQAVANFPDAAATISVEVREVVFTDSETAAVRFELYYEHGAQFGEQIGQARFVDGRWKVARSTTCRVLGWAGASC